MIQESSIQSAHVTPTQIFQNITEYLNRQDRESVGRRHFRVHSPGGHSTSRDSLAIFPMVWQVHRVFLMRYERCSMEAGIPLGSRISLQVSKGLRLI